MKPNHRLHVLTGLLLVATGAAAPLSAQSGPPQGHPIGSVKTDGNLIVLQLDSGAVAPADLFDLAHTTLRFTPDSSGYRVENLSERWDAQIGDTLSGSLVALRSFAFPFSGRTWDTLTVGATGTIAFGSPADGPQAASGARGLSVGRFAQLREAAGTLVNGAPGIAVFLKPRMHGTRYVKQLADRVVVTWNVTEPYGGIFDFTWKPTTNWFQAVLRRDGTIDLTYGEMSAKDAIVGLYPSVDSSETRVLATLSDPSDQGIPPHEDLRSVELSSVGGILARLTFETRGAVPAAGDSGVAGVTYRATLRTPDGKSVEWAVRSVQPRRPGTQGGQTRWVAYGPGVSSEVRIDSSKISIEGTLPEAFDGADRVSLSAEVTASSGRRGRPAERSVDRMPAGSVSLAGLRSAAADLSTLEPKDGPFGVVYQAFHWYGLPRTVDLSCTVIGALGDNFDFLVWYSDFRLDNQEAGTPSTGPRGGDVTGINEPARSPTPYCSAGHLQWMYVQPVYIGSNQGQERSPDGSMSDYDYAMSQIGHELGHRWTADALAVLGHDTVDLGPTHWARGLQAPAAFPYTRPVEASAMGGGVWQDNHDGTYTQLDDDFFVPASGYSYLDLYLMGLMRPDEVPDFFLLTNLLRVGRDDRGQPVFGADKRTVTIEDVIAANGPRRPDFEHAQKRFRTGIVAVVLHGKEPSPELVARANAIGDHWVGYWEKITGHRASMTTVPSGG